MDLITGPHEFSGAEFKNLALPGAKIHGRMFEGCTFFRCVFREASFESCRFSDCTFRKCDLTFVRVPDSAFAETTFEDCQLIGVNWTEAAWTKSLLRQPLIFRGCALNHSVLTGIKLRGLELTKSVARDVDFSECDLTKADFTGTDFSETRFSHTNLTEANFTGATNYNISATLNTLKKTRFSLPEAIALLRNLDIILTEE